MFRLRFNRYSLQQENSSFKKEAALRLRSVSSIRSGSCKNGNLLSIAKRIFRNKGEEHECNCDLTFNCNVSLYPSYKTKILKINYVPSNPKTPTRLQFQPG